MLTPEPLRCGAHKPTEALPYTPSGAKKRLSKNQIVQIKDSSYLDETKVM
jgi:hypothetical protein